MLGFLNVKIYLVPDKAPVEVRHIESLTDLKEVSEKYDCTQLILEFSDNYTKLEITLIGVDNG